MTSIEILTELQTLGNEKVKAPNIKCKIIKDADDLDLAGRLGQIEKEMPKGQPEVQWTMNVALAHIGTYHAAHRKRAIDIGIKQSLMN